MGTAHEATSFGQFSQRAAGVASALLGWRPGEFWAATPAELMAALHGVAGKAPAMLGGDELQRLKERFPDG